jgi:creatinine amidohydrolase/Fe(II)-dependent formamide hydrolase-like protein
MTPTIPVGISNPYKNFPGSMNITSETFKALTKEVCESLIHHGFRRIVFFSAHGGGNLPMLSRVSEELREETGALFSVIHLWGRASARWHPVTSVMLYLKPEPVGMTKAKWIPLKAPLEDMTPIAHSIQKFKDINITIPLFGEEVSEIGVYGDPTKASKRGGRDYFQQ